MGKSQTKAVVWLALLLVSSACAFALDPSLDVSQYAHTAWKIREGFTKGTIFSMAQTPDGYLWLGTEFGLVRFNGVQAIPWQPPTGEQLPSTWIKSLLVGRDGTLWIGTEKGLASWKDGKLTGYPEVIGQAVSSLLQDVEGTLWFGDRDPGRLCAVRAGKTQCYGAGSFGWSVTALYEDHEGNLWASAQTGLWRWAPGSPELFRLPDRAVEARALIEGDNGTLLMATGRSGPLASSVTGVIDGLKQLVGGKIRGYPLPGTARRFRPTCLFRSRDGSLWVGTVEGLLHLHQGRIDRFSVTEGLSGNFIRNIFEDREGNVWVSTENGLDRFREFAVPTISENEEGLSTSAVTVLQATPDGSIWILTADGLNRWQNGHVTVYGGKPSVPGQNSRIDERKPITNARVTEIANSGLRGAVYSLGQDDRGGLWAGGGEGVFYFDRDRFVRVPGVPGGNISAIAGDGQGKVWISSLDQSLFYSTPEGAIQRIPWGRFGHKHGAVALLPDRLQGGLWLGFLSGGIAYLKDGQVRASYNVADGMGSGEVSDLQLGSDGAVWAATQGGLSRVKDGRVTTLTSRNGLPCDAVNWVMEDNDHSFWLYMSCGLVRIARSELDAWVSDAKRSVQTTVFDSSDGVRTRALPGPYGRKVTKSLDGKIWFSPPDGVSVIDPRHLPFNKVPPPVHIEQITADGKTYEASSGLRLPPLVHDLTIDYTALSFVAPEKVRFRYKLEGQDPDWREVVNGREVQYSNLAPGNYRFRVPACNNSGVWNEAGTFLDFSIAPAYYQTTWFRAILGAALVFSLWGVYRIRVRSIEQRYRERELAAEKLQRSEAHLSEAQRLSHTGSFDWRVSAGELFWSEETFRIFQYDRTTTPTVDLVLQRVHPEDVSQWKQDIERATQDGRDFDHEYRLLMPDGSVKYLQIVAHAQPNKSGALDFVGAVTDVTAARRAEEKIRQSEQELRDTIETIPVMAFIAGPNVRTAFRNRRWREYTGLPSEDTEGTGWRTVIHPEDLERMETWRERLAAGERTEDEARFRRAADGEYRWFLFRAVPLRDITGNVLKWYGVLIDIEDRKRAEEALRQSEAYLSEAQKLTHSGSWAHDGRTREPLYWSEEVYRIIGFDPQKGLPTRDQAWERIHPEDRAKVKEASDKTFREKTDYDIEYRIVLPDGTVKHTRVLGHPVLNPDGDIVEVVGANIDITERKLAEEALRESETRFRTFVDHAGDALFVLDFEQGTIVDVNRQACESVGYTRQELIGNTAAAFHPNSDGAEMESAAERAAAGETVVDTHYHRRKDGTVFPVEADTSCFWYGGRRFVLHVSRDITDRLRAEEKLRQSEAELRQLVDAIPQQVFVFDADWSPLFANRRELEYTGLTSQEMQSRDAVARIFHPDDLKKLDVAHERARSDGAPIEMEARIRGKDGEYRWFLVRDNPLRDERGRVLRWYGTRTDIEDRKRAEEQLQQSEGELRQIVDVVPQHIVVLDPDGEFFYVNRRDLEYSGLTLKDIHAADYPERIFHPDDWERLRYDREHSIARGTPWEAEARLLGKDGQYRWFLIRLNPLRDEQGHIIRWYGTRTDVEDRKRTAEALMEERVNERTRIARELHDTLLQSFHGLMLRFQTVSYLLPARPEEAKERLDSAIDQAAQAITEGRDAIQGLRSLTVETQDLALAIKILGDGLAADKNNQNLADFQVVVEGTPRNLDPILSEELYRIAGEALRNAFRHAQARQIEAEICYDERKLQLRVRDDGKGIDPTFLSGEARAGHYGLRGMHERAKLVGGELVVWSKLEAGTEIELSIPASTAYTTPARRRSWF